MSSLSYLAELINWQDVLRAAMFSEQGRKALLGGAHVNDVLFSTSWVRGQLDQFVLLEWHEMKL